MNIEVGGSSLDGSVSEEAAILYANGQTGEARECLAKAVRAGGDERCWRMLLDLHLIDGDRAAFDALALEFAQRFECSAPAWLDPAAAAAKGASSSASKTAPTAPAAALTLSGKLTAASATLFEPLRAAKPGGPALRIDLSGLAGGDAAGCRLLLQALQSLRTRKVAAELAGESTLLAGLARVTLQGARRADPALWLLRLELLQWLGREEEFDTVALDYAVTFEESPPSFETPHAQSVRPAARATAAAPAAHVAPPEVLGDGLAYARELEEWVGTLPEAAEVRINLAGTRRIGFVAAGALLNAVMRLHAQGRSVHLDQPNALVAGLLDLMGLGEVARIHARR